MMGVHDKGVHIKNGFVFFKVGFHKRGGVHANPLNPLRAWP